MLPNDPWSWGLPWTMVDLLGVTVLERTDFPNRYQLQVKSWSGLKFCISFHFSMLGFCLVWTCAGHVCNVTISGNLYVYQTGCVWKIHFMKILSGQFFVCFYILWCTPKIKNKLQNDNKTYFTYWFSLPSFSMLVKWKYFIEHMCPRIFFSHSFFGIMSFIFFIWLQVKSAGIKQSIFTIENYGNSYPVLRNIYVRGSGCGLTDLVIEPVTLLLCDGTSGPLCRIYVQ